MVTKKAVPYEDLCAAAEILKVLTHADRLAICQFLLEKEYSVGELCKLLALKQNVVSQHLSHLRARSIVSSHRDGKLVFYSVTHPAPSWLLSCISSHYTKNSKKSHK